MTNADIVFALFCVFVLPFAYGQDIPPGRSCSCTAGLTCDFSQVYCAPFDGGECRRENIALGQPATISSLHRALNDLGNAACIGVNGNTNNHWLPLEESPTGGNCIHTSPFQEGVHFWEVDLGKNYLIKHITLYSRITQAVRMIHVTVLVEKTICYTFEQSPAAKSYYNVECKPPVTGRLVRLEKPPFDPKYRIRQIDYCMNVCEIQVWVCKQGFYGGECNEVCDPCVHCDIVDGTCSGGCKVGHYGHRCLQTCSNCVDDKCNDQGICLAGCKTGFKGEKCDIICGQICDKTCFNCKDTNCNDDSVCLDGCIDKKWTGPKCSDEVLEEKPEIEISTEAKRATTTTTTAISPPTAEESSVGSFVAIGIVILALLATAVTCCILAARRRKKEDENRLYMVQTAATEKQEIEESGPYENSVPVLQENIEPPPLSDREDRSGLSIQDGVGEPSYEGERRESEPSYDDRSASNIGPKSN